MLCVWKLCGNLILDLETTQASLRAKLDKEEKSNTNASKNDGLQGVELQLEQKAAAEASSGCCSAL